MNRKIYFPQWQGAGLGKEIEPGAKTILDHLGAADFHAIPLSEIPAGKNGKQYHSINNYEAIFEQLTRFKEFLEIDNPDTLQTIGGDCGLEIVPVSYLNKKYPDLGVIWFDAHADINRPCDSPSCNFHGMPLRTLLGEGEPQMNPLLASTLEASQIHYVGLRDVDQAEQDRINKDSIYVSRLANIPELIDTLKGKGMTHLYLHFDFDCLNPKDYDKTYYKVPSGLSIATSEAYIKALQREFKVMGSSVLESITTSREELQPITGILNLLMS